MVEVPSKLNLPGEFKHLCFIFLIFRSFYWLVIAPTLRMSFFVLSPCLVLWDTILILLTLRLMCTKQKVYLNTRIFFLTLILNFFSWLPSFSLWEAIMRFFQLYMDFQVLLTVSLIGLQAQTQGHKKDRSKDSLSSRKRNWITDIILRVF